MRTGALNSTRARLLGLGTYGVGSGNSAKNVFIIVQYHQYMESFRYHSPRLVSLPCQRLRLMRCTVESIQLAFFLTVQASLLRDGLRLRDVETSQERKPKTEIQRRHEQHR
jgi:hypothetical protein